MSYNHVILLLGTNLGDKKSNLKRAESHISKRIGAIVNKSEILETEPLGFESVHLFLNQTLVLETLLSPLSLLNEIKSIEKEMGRDYKKKNEGYEDRMIDIDILVFNKIRYESKRLTLPHHQIISRNFVKMLLRF